MMFRRFLKNESGVTAIEFAILGPLFLTFLLSMFETGWMMTKVVVLEQAVAQTSRIIYTGKAPTQEALEDEICDYASVFSDCLDNINIESVIVSDFNSPPDDDVECRDSSDTTFNPTVKYDYGSSASIVFLRVCITTDVFMPGIGFGLAVNKTDNGRVQMVASTAFMNEPF